MRTPDHEQVTSFRKTCKNRGSFEQSGCTLRSVYLFVYAAICWGTTPLLDFTRRGTTRCEILHFVSSRQMLDQVVDTYKSLMTLPSTLTTPYILPLQPHVIYILKILLDAQVFYILPSSQYYALNPRALPREVFVQDCDDVALPTSSGHFTTAETGIPKKRKGRPSKREKAKKAKDALATLKNWHDKTEESSDAGQPLTSASRETYRKEKSELLDGLDDGEGRQLLERVNHAVLGRMRKVDQLAAEKGLEVGGEGGERTGLARVEKAVQGMVGGKNVGLLGLLDGGGLDETAVSDVEVD
jgi:hypothetical protein